MEDLLNLYVLNDVIQPNQEALFETSLCSDESGIREMVTPELACHVVDQSLYGAVHLSGACQQIVCCGHLKESRVEAIAKDEDLHEDSLRSSARNKEDKRPFNDQYLLKIRALADNIIGCGSMVTDCEIIVYALEGLQANFKSFRLR